MKDLNWELDKGFLSKVEALLPEVDVVSLDIFDTALTRLVDSPVDVFAEAERRLVDEEKIEDAVGFAVRREDAEQRARYKAHLDRLDDVTFDMIYAELKEGREFKSKAMRTECEVERDYLIAVPEILEIVNLVKRKGKKFIFVSDMYLPSGFLLERLKECGYTNIKVPFVSGDLNATKHKGSIWPKVKSALNVPYAKILHIGDDKHSDVFIPALLGVKTLLFDKARSERRTGARLTPSLLPYSVYRRKQVLESKATDTKQKWINLGYALGAMFLQAFTDWLYERAKANKIERLYFLSRDGWLLHRAWEIAGYDIESKYLYVSRRALNPAAGYIESTERSFSPHLSQYLFGIDPDTTLRTLIRRLNTFPAKWVDELITKYGSVDCKVLEHTLGVREYEMLIHRNSSAIMNGLAVQYENTCAYLKQEGVFDDSRIGIVDTGWNGTLHRSLNLLRGQLRGGKLSGFYMGLWPSSTVNRADCGHQEAAFASPFELPSDNPEIALGVALLEELCTAPHSSVHGYSNNRKPFVVFSNRDNESNQYNDKISAFQSGALAGLVKLYDDKERVSIEEAKAAIAQVILSPSQEELELLGSLSHAMAFDHSTFHPLLQPMPSTDREASTLIQTSDWRPGLLRHWMINAETPEERKRVHSLAQTHLSPYMDNRQLRQFRT